MRPAAVLWDMDGTLVDSEKVWDVSLHECVRWLGGELSAAARSAMVGSNMSATVQLLLAEVGRPASRRAIEDTAGWLRGRTRELFAAGLPWRPGAEDALAEVRAMGTPTGLVTSTERELTEIALRSIGWDWFDVIVCGDEVSANKPDPAPYRQAAARLGVAARNCVAVEDSPTGVRAAVDAGCTVLVVPSELPVPPGPRRVLRESLIGFGAAELAAMSGPVSLSGGRAAGAGT